MSHSVSLLAAMFSLVMMMKNIRIIRQGCRGWKRGIHLGLAATWTANAVLAALAGLKII